LGFVFSILGGLFISLQNVINAGASRFIGLWGTNSLVHGLGFFISTAVLLASREGQMSRISEVPKGYLLGGLCGVMIVYSIMRGVNSIGPSLAVSIMVISQLAFAYLIDALGLFGVEPLGFNPIKPLGLAVMITGLLIFQSR
jgi:transporter family-2 protein